MSSLRLFAVFLLVFAFGHQANAQGAAAFDSSGFPVPRFVSLRSEKVYARSGPALRYPIRWEFRKQGLPVEIIQEFDTWRKIRDIDGEEGWVHQSLISGARTVIINTDNEIVLRRSPDLSAQQTAKVEPGVVAKVRRCPEGIWCQIEVQGFRGWIERKSLWGIYPNEVLN